MNRNQPDSRSERVAGTTTGGDDPQKSRKTRRVLHQAAFACVNCARLKMKCEVETSQMVCKRCTISGVECSWRASKRGKWIRRKKHPAEGSESREDSIILEQEMSGSEDEVLIPHFETPAEEPRDFGGGLHFKVDSSLYPMGLLAESSLTMRQDSGVSPHEEHTADESPQTGPAAPTFFSQGLNTQLRPKRPRSNRRPKVLENELLTEEEAAVLFDLYFMKCNPHINLLDRNLCSVKTCSSRSPFLFTAICAVAARYFKGGALYPPLMRAAKSAGLEAMLEAKNTYTVQGFIILAYWGPPATSYELDNSFLFAGIAIRLGHEIGIHHKNLITFSETMSPKLKQHYLSEMLNRERTWFCCFVIDRSSCALSGKPETLFEKYLIRSSTIWCDQAGTTVGDVFLMATVEIQRIIWRLLDLIYSSSQTKSAISPTINYYILAEDMTQRLDDWLTQWDDRLVKKDVSSPHPYTREYRAQLRLQMNFHKLIPLSIALQNCLEHNQDEKDAILFCYPSYQCACDAVEIGVESLSGTRWMKYATDHWTTSLTYCACYLLKLLNTPYAHMFDREKTITLAEKTASALESAAESIEHSPYAYATFIRKRVEYERTPQGNRGDAPPPTFAPNQQEQLNVFGPPMLGGYAVPNAPDVQNPMSSTDTGQLEMLLETDWLDSFLTQQNQMHPISMPVVSPSTGFAQELDFSQVPSW